MYLGRNHISLLPNFLLGYQFCSTISPPGIDFYFGQKGFLHWYEKKYNPSPKSFWKDYFLERVGNDEAKALDLYFETLEDYHNWYKLDEENNK